MTRNLEIQEYKNKYRIAAEEIYANLGSGNYTNVYNCVTRFRAHILNKNDVNINNIKKLNVVKDVRYSGDELQIIIGGEVTKVLDEFIKYEKEILTPIVKTKQPEIQAKKSIWSKIIGAIVGIMSPVIPVLLAGSIMAALQSLLSQYGVIASISDMNDVPNHDVWSGVFYITSQLLLKVIGVFFIYNTAKYFGGNRIFALMVGVTLVCRGLFPTSTIGVDLKDAHFGDWIISGDGATYTQTFGKTGWLLFKLGAFPITVCGYEGSVIPFIVGGIIVTYFDKWVKTWMPSTIDTIFRPALVYIVSMLGLWFIFAPLFGLIEYGLTTAINWSGNLQFGIGTMIFAFAWQIMVFFGISNTLSAVINLPLINGETSALVPSMDLATYGQLGAVIGVIIITKNKNLKAIGVGTVPGAIFGITEPMMYGITIPKFKTFIFGLTGGALGGLLSGNLGIHMNHLSGWGIFSLLGYTEGIKQILLVLLTYAVTLSISILLTVCFYTERKNELSYFKKGVNKLINFTKGNKETVHSEFEPYKNEINSMKHEYKKMSKYYSEISHYEQQMVKLENQESHHRHQMYQKLIKLKTKLMKKDNEEIYAKFESLNQKYSNYNLDQQKENVQKKLKKVINENQELFAKFNSQKNEIYSNACQKVNLHIAKDTSTEMLVIQNIFWNALNSVEIGFGIEDAKPTKFKKEVK